MMKIINKINSIIFGLQAMRYIQHFFAYARRGLLIEGLRMFYNMMFARLGLLRLPVIYISPSHDCNANCVHCFEKFQHEKFKDSLSTERIKNVIDQFYELGGSKVFFCSGEFLLRKDCLELIQYARSRHILVGVTTNGILLNEKKLDELKRAGLTDLIVSIDSDIPENHDRMRGVPGCFERAVHGLRIARDMGMMTYIWTYITKSNINHIEGLLKLGRELRVMEIFVFFPILSGHLFNRFDENLTFEEREAIRKRFNRVQRLHLAFPSEKSKCMGGGRNHINVMSTGDVTFCPTVPYSYGNIKSKSLKECLLDTKKDYERFFASRLTGQCPVNFIEYRENCNAEFIYKVEKRK